MKDMFIAGTDTSSTTLVWIMAELIRNPAAMRKAQEEVRGVVKESGSLQVNESHLPELAYLKMVIKEVLRLHLHSHYYYHMKQQKDAALQAMTFLPK